MAFNADIPFKIKPRKIFFSPAVRKVACNACNDAALQCRQIQRNTCLRRIGAYTDRVRCALGMACNAYIYPGDLRRIEPVAVAGLLFFLSGDSERKPCGFRACYKNKKTAAAAARPRDLCLLKHPHILNDRETVVRFLRIPFGPRWGLGVKLGVP